jgi:hypothetical protein
MPAIAGSSHREVTLIWSIFRTRPAIAGALVLLLAALLLAGCGGTTTQAGASGTRTPAAPTATRIAATPTLPPAPLSWEDATLPPGYIGGIVSYNLGPLAVAPGDGNIAYACALATPHNGVPATVGTTIWLTQDRAQHWSRLAPLPVVPQFLTSCWIVPDAVDPSIVVAGVSWAREGALGEPLFMQSAQFVSFVGGTQWQSLTGSQPFVVRWLATYHGTTMAEVDTNVPAVGYGAFWISYDHMRTWQASSTAEPQYRSIFINPTTGELLGVGGNAAGPIVVPLETSDDFGLHWTTIATPTGATPIVSPPAGSQPWRMCVIVQSTDNGSNKVTDTGPNTGGTLMCSLDGGKTWSQRPRLAITYTDPNTGPGSQVASECAVGPDGTIYADMPAIMPTIPDSAIPDTVYRLAPGSDRWQSLGASPVDLFSQESEYASAELPGAGIFWYQNNLDPVEEFQLFNS